MASPTTQQRPAATRVARVIVGIDPSVTGLRALRIAVDLARAPYADLHAVRAWTYPAAWHNTADNRHRREVAREAGAHCLAAAFDETFGRTPTDIAIYPVLREGDARRVLLSYADRDDDRLVLGGRTGNWWTHGSGATTRYCLAKSRHPVIVVSEDA